MRGRKVNRLNVTRKVCEKVSSNRGVLVNLVVGQWLNLGGKDIKKLGRNLFQNLGRGNEIQELVAKKNIKKKLTVKGS